MNTTPKPADSRVKLGAPQLPAGVRSGGETRPLPYPHLYQIQAGDWRISYAVEHNRLAILVLEVLTADGGSSKDAAQEKLKRRMKVRLLDWPEGKGHASLPPEESKRLKIKWMDLGDEIGTTEGGSRVKLKPVPENRINWTGPVVDAEATDPAEPGPDTDELLDGEGKVTPLDEPTM